MHKVFGEYDEAKCLECELMFGVHDTSLLRPIFREHICKKETE